MKVTCPNCETKYNLPDDKIPGDGANVRCTRCKHVFHVDKTPPPPPPPPDPEELSFPDEPPAGQPGTGDADIDDLFSDVGEPEKPQAPAADPADIDDLFDEPAGEKAETAGDGRPAAKDEDIDELFGSSEPVRTEEKLETGTEDIEDLFGGAGDKKDDKPEAGKPIVFETEKKGLGKGGLGLAELGKTLAKDKGEKGRLPALDKKTMLIAAAALVALALAGGSLYFFKIWPFAEPKPAQVAEPQAPKAEEKKVEDGFKNLALTGVRQYMIDDAKAGKLFVIEGKVRNNFATPKEYIKVEASLFDDKGISLATKQVVGGNSVSYFNLKMQTAEEIEAALTSQVGILTNNLNVRQGGEVPFMIVFVNPPETLQEFGVKVVDAKDPS